MLDSPEKLSLVKLIATVIDKVHTLKFIRQYQEIVGNYATTSRSESVESHLIKMSS